MKGFLAVAKREIDRILKRPALLAIMFFLPLLICFVLCETFKQGSPRNLPIAVLDLDNTSATRQISRMIDATPACEVKYKVASLEEGKQLIVGGQTYALVVIPRGFTKDVYKGKRPQLVYYYNNQMILIGGIITKDVTTAVQTAMAGVNVAVQMRKGIPKDVAISRVNVIRVDERVRSNPYLNYSYFLSLASFINTFQILICFIAIWAVGSEFKEGSSKEWMELSGDSILTAVFAKLTPYIISFMLIITLTYLIYFIGYGAPFEGNILFVGISTLVFVLAYQFMGVLYVALTSNLRLSLSSGAFYTSLGFTFAGMTYPNIAMNSFAKFYSALLPIRPYVSLMVDQAMRGFLPKYDLGYLLWLSAFVIFASAFLPLLKKHAYDESQWYKL